MAGFEKWMDVKTTGCIFSVVIGCCTAAMMGVDFQASCWQQSHLQFNIGRRAEWVPWQ